MDNLLSNLIINNLYSATTMYTEKGATSKRKKRPCWAIVIKYEGQTLYLQKNRKIISNYNNIVILPKGSDYEWICTKSGHFAIVEFQSDLESDEIYNIYIRHPEKLLNTIKNIENKRLVKNNFYKIESIKDTYSIILQLLKQSNSSYLPSEKKLLLNPVIEYIAENYTQKIKNDTLAAISGFSTVYFRKLFKEAYGISPIEYIKELKIKKAKEMLHSDYGSISDIALSLGYQNIYDFSRDFKKHTGVSPGKYL